MVLSSVFHLKSSLLYWRFVTKWWLSILEIISIHILFITAPDIFRKQIETSGEEPPPMSGSSACVMEGKSMFIFAGHCDGGPTSTVCW